MGYFIFRYAYSNEQFWCEYQTGNVISNCAIYLFLSITKFFVIYILTVVVFFKFSKFFVRGNNKISNLL